MRFETRSRLFVVLWVLLAVGMHVGLIVGRSDSFCSGGENGLRWMAVSVGVVSTLPALGAVVAYWWDHSSAECSGAVRCALVVLLLVPLVSFGVFYMKAAQVPGVYCA